MNTKAFFPYLGGSNLILGIGRENQIFLLRTPATVFHYMLNFSPTIHPMRKNLILPGS